MFKRNGKATASEAGMADKKALHPSIISAGLTVTGDMVSNGEIQVDGRVEGDIRCSSLVIGVAGEVVGEVRATSMRLLGQLTGQVFAEKVFMAATARMVGDIHHQSLAIEPGAYLQGMCRRSDDEVAQAETPALAAPDEEGQVRQQGAAIPGRAVPAGVVNVAS